MGFAEQLAKADRGVLTLGAPVTYEPLGAGDPTPIGLTGIFDAVHEDSRNDQGVAARGPALFVRLEDLVTASGVPFKPARADRVTVAGVQYRVREPRVDGQGGALLHLMVV